MERKWGVCVQFMRVHALASVTPLLLPSFPPFSSVFEEENALPDAQCRAVCNDNLFEF